MKKREKLLASPSCAIYRVGLTFLHQQTRGAQNGYLSVSDGLGLLSELEKVFPMILIYKLF